VAYSVYQLATLANAVYYKGQTLVGQWRRSTTFGNPDSGGFFAAVYGCGLMNVLAYRGTNDPWDVSPDAQLLFGEVPSQIPQAELAWTRAVSALPQPSSSASLVLTGHSLGGALAAMVAAKSGVPAVTFNAPGVARSYAASFRLPFIKPGTLPITPLTLPGAVAGAVALAQLDSLRVINIRASYDVVSLGTGPRLGRVETIPVAGCASVKITKPKPKPGTLPSFDPVDGIIEMGAMAARAIATGANYLLCQHGMELMEQQLKNMPEYHEDLGW
jgi:hypothetical protein